MHVVIVHIIRRVSSFTEKILGKYTQWFIWSERNQDQNDSTVFTVKVHEMSFWSDSLSPVTDGRI
jgi:hypothetical protein